MTNSPGGIQPHQGRPVVGAIGGVAFGAFLWLDLLVAGLVSINSILLWILPPAGAVAGAVLGYWAPLGRWWPPKANNK